MKKLLFCAALMCAAMFSSCGDEYDDTALRKEMESIKDRVAALEERLTQEVNTLKGLIKAAEEGLAVSVEETADGYEVTIGDGEPITIYHGKDGENGTDGTNGTQITVVEVDGVYYWAINGEATGYRVTGNDGEDGEDGEDGYTPEIKDGKWYINGEEVGPATGENGEDGDSFFKDVTVNDDDTVTFTLADDTTITVALAKSAKYTDVQSIKFVPEYEDGKVTVGYYTGAEDAFVVAKYEVTPKAAAATIAKYAKDASMQAVYTKTRAEAGELVVLPVTAIEAEEGIITVTATAADLAEEFFAGTLSASIRFAVQDDLSGNASEYVAAVAAKAELPAMEVAAVAEGYQAAKLTWSEVAGAAYYQIKAGADVVAKAEGVTEFVVEKLTAANNYAFTVEACTSADKVLTSGSTEEIQIFSLTNRPEPVVTLADGVLTLANAEINPSATIKDNLHIYGAVLEAEIYFYKDGATEPTYTAAGTYLDSYPTADLPKSYEETKLKNDVAGPYTAWKWNGAAEATKTVPEFEAGVYTVKYKAGYHTFVNASYGSERLLFTAPTDALQTIVYREADSDLTFTVEQTYKLNAQASIDNGTDEICKLFTSWPGNPPSSFATYDWYGLRSLNGQFEAVTLAWDAIEEADKIVVEYLDQEVEVVTGLPFHIVSGLKTSPVDFTITAYQGETVLVSEKVSSDVYTLPEAAAGTFNAVYSAEKGGWNLIGENFNTNQYATWSCSFNLYEKGSDTPVFENPITKNGDNNNDNYLAWACQGKVETSLNDHDAFKVNDGDFEWDNGKVFTGLKGNTEYEVRFELNVWPFIYDAANAGNNDKTYMYKKVLMGSEKANGFGAIKLPGTYTFTTGEGPAEFEVLVSINEGTEKKSNEGGHRGMFAKNGIYQGAKISWNNCGAASYDVYYKVAGAAEWTKQTNVTDLAYTFESGSLVERKYDFKVVALDASNQELLSKEVSADIYTLKGVEENLYFEAILNEDGTYNINTYGIGYENYSFVKFEFDIYKAGETTPSYQVNKDIETTAQAWAKNRGASSYNEINNSDYSTKVFTLEAGATYDVKVRYSGYSHIYDAEADATDYHNHPEWYYYSSVLDVVHTAPEFTVQFTAPKSAINWDYVVGAYVVDDWASPYWNTDVQRRYDKLGYGFWYNYVKLVEDCKKDGEPLGTPKDGQRYGMVYSWNNHALFDISSTEIDPATFEPKAGTGCYQIVNLIDREQDWDHVENNYSYYDKNEEAFYFSFTLTSGGVLYRHDGKMHSRGTVDMKE